MEVFINHVSVEMEDASSLTDLLTQQEIATEGIAVAVGNKVVPRAEWAATRLEPGAKITVIRAVCGG